jgi:hypothetical protein
MASIDSSPERVETWAEWNPRWWAEGDGRNQRPGSRSRRESIDPLVALMDSKNENVAVRAAEALLDSTHARNGREWKGERPVPRVIQVEFVTPPKRDDNHFVSQRPSLIGLPEPK